MVTLKGTITVTHTQTWSASLVDSTQQLDAALVAPVVEDPGKDVEVGVRQRVFEEIPWKTHTVQATACAHTHTSQDIDRLDSQIQTMDIEQYDGDDTSHLQMKCFYDLIIFFLRFTECQFYYGIYSQI